MIHEASTAVSESVLRDLREVVCGRHGSIVLTEGGRPIAAIVDMATFEQAQQDDQAFDDLLAAAAAGFADLPEAEGMRIVDEAVRAVRGR